MDMGPIDAGLVRRRNSFPRFTSKLAQYDKHSTIIKAQFQTSPSPMSVATKSRERSHTVESISRFAATASHVEDLEATSPMSSHSSPNHRLPLPRQRANSAIPLDWLGKRLAHLMTELCPTEIRNVQDYKFERLYNFLIVPFAFEEVYPTAKYCFLYLGHDLWLSCMF